MQAPSIGEPIRASRQERPGYLPHIDGLRALAVIAVILYHANVPFLTGGFAGVDVFFTISGFVITRLVIAEIAEGTFSVFGFYARRIRRLLPALLPVLLAVAALGWFVMLPDDYANLGNAIIATLLFCANIFFWREADYFITSTKTEPLLNMWSLGVEEQFYLFAPFLLLGLVKLARGRFLLSALAVLALASFFLSLWALPRSPVATFYLLPMRAWEIILGSMLAVAMRGGAIGALVVKGGSLNTALTSLGLAMLFWSFFVLDSATPFPGAAALPACLGTAMVIAGGTNAVARPLLENRAALAIGLVSYAAYLWHWPLLALWRYRNFGDLVWQEGVPILLLSLCLAVASYRLVEGPFRHGRWRGLPAPWLALGVAIPVLVTGILLRVGDGFPQRVSTQVNAVQSSDVEEAGAGCVNGVPREIAPADSCVLPEQSDTARWALWGDSHAFALADAVAEALPEGESVRVFGALGCPPVIATQRAEALVDCASYNREVLNYLVSAQDMQRVILAGRHAAATKGATDSYGPAEDDLHVPPVSLVPQTGLPDTPLPQGYLERFAATVRTLREAGKEVIIVLPVPEVGYHVPRTMALRAMRGMAPDGFTRPRSMYAERNGDFIAAARILARDHGVSLFDPTLELCDAQYCATAIKGVALYSDDDHLSRAGAELLADGIVSAHRGREDTELLENTHD